MTLELFVGGDDGRGELLGLNLQPSKEGGYTILRPVPTNAAFPYVVQRTTAEEWEALPVTFQGYRLYRQRGGSR